MIVALVKILFLLFVPRHLLTVRTFVQWHGKTSIEIRHEKVSAGNRFLYPPIFPRTARSDQPLAPMVLISCCAVVLPEARQPRVGPGTVVSSVTNSMVGSKRF
uniref:Putative secreted protein n=1 Tax=Anopheles darlingi TaxID=43151 RepID=A0A2M4DHZ8_ANODA